MTTCHNGCKYSDKKSKNTATHTGTEILSEDQHLANELQKLITGKREKRKIYPSHRDNI